MVGRRRALSDGEGHCRTADSGRRTNGSFYFFLEPPQRRPPEKRMWDKLWAFVSMLQLLIGGQKARVPATGKMVKKKVYV